jgi:hypothetical protein
MLKKVLLLVAVLVQIGLFSTPTANADGSPEPTCFPCSR